MCAFVNFHRQSWSICLEDKSVERSVTLVSASFFFLFVFVCLSVSVSLFLSLRQCFNSCQFAVCVCVCAVYLLSYLTDLSITLLSVNCSEN